MAAFKLVVKEPSSDEDMYLENSINSFNIDLTGIPFGGKVAVPHLAPYCASKFALVGLSDALRNELARDNIHVTTVTPGMMRTGSHVNAKFKGNHGAEYSWFAISAALPFVSLQAERAAAKIISACRRGSPSLTIPLSTRALTIGNALFPNFTGSAMKLANSFLPPPGDPDGDTLRSGWESRAETSLPRWLLRFADRATARNNEEDREIS